MTRNRNHWTTRKSTLLYIVFLICILSLMGAPGQAADTDSGTIFLSLAETSTSYALYKVDPDTAQHSKLYDFSGEPYDKEGEIFAPRVSSDGGTLFFHSNNASAWVPVDYNLFAISTSGSGKNQITPDSASGQWNQPGPYGSVSGNVEMDGGGFSVPAANAAIYIEGLPMTTADHNGNFFISNVPPGARYLVAYRADYSHYDFTALNVVAGQNYATLTLHANTLLTGTKARYSKGVPHKDRIYYKYEVGGSYPQDIKYTDIQGNIHQGVYHTDMDACFAHVQDYDIGQSGDMIIINYASGCLNQSEHNGIYQADKDGNYLQLLINMGPDDWYNSFVDPNDYKIFWNPDETRFVIKGPKNDGFGSIDRMAIYTIEQGITYKTGDVLADNGSQKLSLYGWSPDGNWILYAQHDGNDYDMKLKKIKVLEDGSFDLGSDTTLLTGGPFTGGTWAKKPTASSNPWTLFTPVIVNAARK